MRWALVLLFGLGCGERSQEPELNDSSEDEPALTGVWTTYGVDQILGAVEVSMELKPDGSLSMVMVLASGGRRSFPGTWKLDTEELVLRGAYFTPDGESRVRWSWRVRSWFWRIRWDSEKSGSAKTENEIYITV